MFEGATFPLNDFAYRDAPLIALVGLDYTGVSDISHVWLKDGFISGLTHPAATTENLACCVVGTNFSGFAPIENLGTFIVDGVHVDTSGKTYANTSTLASEADCVFGNPQDRAVFKHCRITGTGAFGHGWCTRGSNDVEILDNFFESGSTGATASWGHVIWALAKPTAGRKSDRPKIIGNSIQATTSYPIAAGYNTIFVNGQVSYVVERPRVLNNYAICAGSTANISIDKATDGIVIGNIAGGIIAYATATNFVPSTVGGGTVDDVYKFNE